MSGHALYDIDIKKYNHVNIQIVKATKENFKEYGNFVYDYENEIVEIVPFPINSNSKRKLYPNTGIGGGIIEGEFIYCWKNNICYAHNKAVENGEYIIAIKKNNHIYTREANYHPDGGQVFYPLEKKPFIMLLALPIENDYIEPKDFIAFYFDGSCGLQIKPNIWHQPAFPLCDDMKFIGKQGKIHGCVCYDSVNEHNVLLCLNSLINI